MPIITTRINICTLFHAEHTIFALILDFNLHIHGKLKAKIEGIVIISFFLSMRKIYPYHTRWQYANAISYYFYHWHSEEASSKTPGAEFALTNLLASIPARQLEMVFKALKIDEVLKQKGLSQLFMASISEHTELHASHDTITKGVKKTRGNT